GEERARPVTAGPNLSATRKDGTEFPVDIDPSASDTSEGMLVEAAIRDVTERVRSEDRNRLFESLLEAAPDAIVVVDSQGRIRLVNAQGETLLAYNTHAL